MASYCFLTFSSFYASSCLFWSRRTAPFFLLAVAFVIFAYTFNPPLCGVSLVCSWLWLPWMGYASRFSLFFQDSPNSLLGTPLSVDVSAPYRRADVILLFVRSAFSLFFLCRHQRELGDNSFHLSSPLHIPPSTPPLISNRPVCSELSASEYFFVERLSVLLALGLFRRQGYSTSEKVRGLSLRLPW